MVLGEINNEWPIDEEIPSFRPYQLDQVVKLNEFVRRLSEGKEATKYLFPECAFGAGAIREMVMSHMRERRRKAKDTEFQKGATFSDASATSGDTESVYESSGSSSSSPPSSDQFHKKKIYAEYFHPSKYQVSDYLSYLYRAFSHDVMAAILVFQNNETAAMLVYQANPVGFEIFSYVNTSYCSNKFA